MHSLQPIHSFTHSLFHKHKLKHYHPETIKNHVLHGPLIMVSVHAWHWMTRTWCMINIHIFSSKTNAVEHLQWWSWSQSIGRNIWWGISRWSSLMCWSADWLSHWRQWACEQVCWWEAERLTFYIGACTRRKRTKTRATTIAQKWVRSRPPITGNKRNEPREEAKTSLSLRHMELQTFTVMGPRLLPQNHQCSSSRLTRRPLFEVKLQLSKFPFPSSRETAPPCTEVDPANQKTHGWTYKRESANAFMQSNIFMLELKWLTFYRCIRKGKEEGEGEGEGEEEPQRSREMSEMKNDRRSQ